MGGVGLRAAVHCPLARSPTRHEEHNAAVPFRGGRARLRCAATRARFPVSERTRAAWRVYLPPVHNFLFTSRQRFNACSATHLYIYKSTSNDHCSEMAHDIHANEKKRNELNKWSGENGIS